MKTKTINYLFTIVTVLLVLSSCQKKPEADFKTVSLNSDGDNELTIYSKIKFQNQTVDGNSYQWDFGDGNTSDSDNPEHQYASPGKYSVQLKAYSKNGKKVSTTTQEIAVNRWNITSFDYTVGVLPASWGDSTGCFEPSCDTLNAKIYFYTGNSTTPFYESPLMPMGENTTDNATIAMTNLLPFTNEDWRITFVHLYSSGAGYKFAEYTFNPVLSPTNGVVNNKHKHYIGFNSGGVGIQLTLYFDKKPE